MGLFSENKLRVHALIVRPSNRESSIQSTATGPVELLITPLAAVKPGKGRTPRVSIRNIGASTNSQMQTRFTSRNGKIGTFTVRGAAQGLEHLSEIISEKRTERRRFRGRSSRRSERDKDAGKVAPGSSQ